VNHFFLAVALYLESDGWHNSRRCDGEYGYEQKQGDQNITTLRLTLAA
jgi:hypothetical protein